MNRIHLGLLIGCAFLLLGSTLLAQVRKAPNRPTSSKLISAKATGSKRYTSAQIIAATGLQLNQPVSEDDFKSVTQQLGETGAFSNVAYSFDFSSEGIKLELQVTDSSPFAPARFENFVWLSDQELMAKLTASVPLFQGQLPVTGRLIDQVSDALQTLAIERQLKGRVDYLRSGPADGPTEYFDFSVTGQDIRIRQVAFPGADDAVLPTLQTAAKRLLGEDYSRTALLTQAQKNFLPVYLERGYLKAVFSDVQPKVVENTPDETLVEAAFPVSAGPQYKLSDLQLAGNKLFPAEKLRELIRLQPGQPANAVSLNADLDAIKSLYGSRGYMAARAAATPEMNDADSTVRYVIQIQEGDIYKMGDLEIRGLDSHTAQIVLTAWKLQEGDTYDSQYPKKFTDSVMTLLPAGGEDWKVEVHESVEDKDKTVDISLHFERKL